MTLSRTVGSLFRAPLVRTRSASQSKAVEMATFASSSSSTASSASAPLAASRPRAYSRTLSSRASTAPRFTRQPSAAAVLHRPIPGVLARGYASDRGKMELYSDEGGATGAGTDDVAHTDAAFDGSKTSPDEAAKGVQEETGKDFTQRSPANEEYSQPKKGEQGKSLPLGTSKVEKGE